MNFSLHLILVDRTVLYAICGLGAANSYESLSQKNWANTSGSGQQEQSRKWSLLLHRAFHKSHLCRWPTIPLIEHAQTMLQAQINCSDNSVEMLLSDGLQYTIPWWIFESKSLTFERAYSLSDGQWYCLATQRAPHTDIIANHVFI